MQMIGHDRFTASARTAPWRRAPNQRFQIARWALIVSFLAGILLDPAEQAWGADAGVELPLPENTPDTPPSGVRVLPGLTLSGYGTLQLLMPDARGRSQASSVESNASEDDSQYSRRTRLDLSHLSAIAWWEPAPEWKVLAEVDLQDVVQLPAHTSQDGQKSEAYVALDRLYTDYRVNDSLSLRAGKFLTPIGRWNQEHSDPQVWTVLRPLISQSAFPTNATGLMVFGSVPVGTQWIDYQTYAADGGEWRPSPRSRPFDRALGARVSTSLNPDVQLGVSVSQFRQEGLGSNEFNLVGADVRWRWLRSDFSGEVIRRRGRDANVSEERGWFAQAVVPLADRWWAVARLEAYRRAIDQSGSRTALLGLVYRGGQHWVFKAEWARASGSSEGLPSGLLSSLTLVY